MSHLDGRTYRVQTDGVSSECVPLWCGVTRGSVTGPIVFTMYTAPTNRILQRYADDKYMPVITWTPDSFHFVNINMTSALNGKLHMTVK